MSLFIEKVFTDQVFFVSVVFTVIVSIVLHELAHGWAAIKLGDRTPIIYDRMNPNPFIHMGVFSIFALLLAGIAWGSMPIDPSRLRGKYGEALVAAAGPAMNLVLGIASFVILGILLATLDTPLNFGGVLARDFPNDLSTAETMKHNFLFFLCICGTWNLALMLFNLFPIPPLDGSHILANFSDGYARFVSDPKHQGVFLIAFMFAFAVGGSLVFGFGFRVGAIIVGLFI